MKTDSSRHVVSMLAAGLVALGLLALAFWIGCAEDDLQNGGPKVIVPLDPVIKSQDGATMILIEAGEFGMGEANASALSDNGPLHTVSIGDFYLDEAEVTNARYATFLAATNRTLPKFWDDPDFNQASQPVVGVTWHDARAYALWAKKRLPTEAEWEKAARAGLISARYPWGNNGPTATLAIYGSARTAPAPVKSTQPNALGLYDMAGNVWEWCNDFYEGTYYNVSPAQDPSGPLFGITRVVRGGSFTSDAAALEVAQRSYLDPADGNAVTGFRCAMSPF